MLLRGIIFYFLLISFQNIQAQIFESPEGVIELYGDEYFKGNHLGTEYLMFANPFYSNTSGDYIQQKIFFFNNSGTGEKTCFMMHILEPISESKVNRDIYDRDFQKLAEDHWLDPETGINYSIEEFDTHCLVTAWIGERNESLYFPDFETF